MPTYRSAREDGDEWSSDPHRSVVRYWAARCRELIAEGRAEFARRQAELDERRRDVQ